MANTHDDSKDAAAKAKHDADVKAKHDADAKAAAEKAAADQKKVDAHPPKAQPKAKIEAPPLSADAQAYGALQLVHSRGFTAAEVATAYEALGTVPVQVRMPSRYPALVFNQHGEERTIGSDAERAELGSEWSDTRPVPKGKV
jgi:hypothetical protein